MCIASHVRDLNDALWRPEIAAEAAPELLVNEPVTADRFETLDGRAWVRVYVDGSALDQHGHVFPHAPRAAEERRLTPAMDALIFA